MSNRATLIPFKKGDPRINRKGRIVPKNFKELREAIQEFLAEPSTNNKTRLDKILSDMARNKGERKALLEFAFGKVPLPIVGPNEGPIKVEFVDETKKKE